MTKWTPNKNRTEIPSMIRMNSFRKLRFGAFSVSSIAIIMFIALGLFYMVSVNIVSTKGGQLHTLQLEKQKIVAENERLALEAARLASLAVIEGGAQEKIEVGDDGQPTGRIFSGEEPEEFTYVPKMVPMNGMTYLSWSSPLAHK